MIRHKFNAILVPKSKTLRYHLELDATRALSLVSIFPIEHHYKKERFLKQLRGNLKLQTRSSMTHFVMNL